MDRTQEIRIPIREVVDGLAVQVTITGQRRWRLRLYLAHWCFFVGSVVLGMPVAFDVRYDGERDGDSDVG